jgi:hypothetical protein
MTGLFMGGTRQVRPYDIFFLYMLALTARPQAIQLANDTRPE